MHALKQVFPVTLARTTKQPSFALFILEILHLYFLCKIPYFSVNVYLPFLRMLRSLPTMRHFPTAKTAKNGGFTISCSAHNKPRLIHSETVVKGVIKNQLKEWWRNLTSCTDPSCWSMKKQNEKDRKQFNNVYLPENIPCSSKIELSYYSVDHFPKICIYYGVRGSLALTW